MNRYIIIALLSLSTITGISYGQKVIAVEDRMLRDSIGENAKRNTKQAGYLTLIRRMTKNAKEDVEATQRLQYDYHDFLKQTSSTASLAVSDAEAEQQAIGLTVGASTHLDDYSFASNLQRVYAEPSEPMEKSRLLYERLAPYNEAFVPTDLSNWEAYQKAQQLNVAALEEMSQRRRLQLANTYRQFAQRKIAQADELRVLLTTAGHLPAGRQGFSMTEGERLETLRRMQDHLQSSQQLNAQADELIRQTARPSFHKQQMLNAFQKAQKRATIADIPLF